MAKLTIVAWKINAFPWMHPTARDGWSLPWPRPEFTLTLTQMLMNPIDDPKDWLPLKEAAHALRVSRHTVVRLCEERDPLTRKPYLHGWRASPGTLLISRASLQD